MEHLTSSPKISFPAQGDVQQSTDKTPLDTLIDPAKSWARLTQTVLDPVTLSRQHILTQAPSTRSAPFDQLRTRILNHMRTKNYNRIAITAPTSGCGSSTLVANLALSFARQNDLRIVVLDLNLRNPQLIHIFGLVENGPRFSALVGARRNFDSSCLRVGDNLALSLNATAINDAAEHLVHAKTTALINQIERDFAPDLMLFDLPALRPMDDAIAGLSLADCALLVARADKSTVSDIDLAERTIAENTNCLGVVLNSCRFCDAAGLSQDG